MSAVSLPPFLRLPLELRIQIYLYLLISPDPQLRLLDEDGDIKCNDVSEGLKVCRLYGSRPPYAPFYFTPALLSVNRQIHAEATHVLYSNHIFEFDHPVDTVIAFLKRWSPSTRALVRDIWIRECDLLLRRRVDFLTPRYETWLEFCHLLSDPDYPVQLQQLTLEPQVKEVWSLNGIAGQRFMQFHAGLELILETGAVREIRIVQSSEALMWELLSYAILSLAKYLTGRGWTVEWGIVKEMWGSRGCLVLKGRSREWTPLMERLSRQNYMTRLRNGYIHKHFGLNIDLS